MFCGSSAVVAVAGMTRYPAETALSDEQRSLISHPHTEGGAEVAMIGRTISHYGIVEKISEGDMVVTVPKNAACFSDPDFA